MDYKEKLVERKDVLLRTFREKKGFTLIELIVVMAIMAILVLVAAPMFLNYTKDAKVASMEQDVRVITDATMEYHIANQELPVNAAAPRIPLVYTDDDAEEGFSGYDNNVYPISEGALDGYISSTSNPISDYGIVFEESGNREQNGRILYIGNSDPDSARYVEDREGNKRVGVNGAVFLKAE